MRFLLYAIGIEIYHALIFFTQAFSTKARQFVQGRSGQYSSIKESIKGWKDEPVIWIHSASYGEYEMAKPIINALRRSNSNLKFVVSFHSPSGFEQIHFDDNSFLKIYLPKDRLGIQKKYLRLINPKAVLFIKYEFWFNFLRALNHLSIPYFFSSLHLNDDSYLFSWWMKPFEKYLQSATRIYAHNKRSVEILKSKGYGNVELFGDSRVEQVLKNKDKGIGISWDNENPCIAFGSILPAEEKYVTELVNSQEGSNYIIAPHDIDDDSIRRLSDQITNCNLFSEIRNSEDPISGPVLVDTMGDLKYLYSNAQVSYVGGGFDKGPHNLLEPLVFGSKILCGPNIKKFPMAQYLKANNLLEVLENQDDIVKILNYSMTGKSEDIEMKIKDFFDQNKTNLEALINDLLKEC